MHIEIRVVLGAIPTSADSSAAGEPARLGALLHGAIEAMAFILSTDRPRKAIDPATNSEMTIAITPQADFKQVHFTSPEMKIVLPLRMLPKFPDRKAVDETNPGIMINAGNLNLLLSRGPQFAGYSFERKSQFAEYLMRMMAVINKRYPLALSPFFWSNYADYVAGRQMGPFVFRMLSDEELLKLSVAPQ